MGDPDEQEGQDLAAEAAEADGGREPAVADGAHHAGDIVHDHENQKRVEQAVAAAEEIAEPGADGSERRFDHMPEFFHEFLTISVSSRFSEASEKLAHSDARHISKKTHVIGLFFEEARDYGKKCFQLYAES